MMVTNEVAFFRRVVRRKNALHVEFDAERNKTDKEVEVSTPRVGRKL